MSSESSMTEVFHYTDADGRDLIDDWLSSLRDRRAVARIAAGLNASNSVCSGTVGQLGVGSGNCGLTTVPGTASILPRYRKTSFCCCVAVPRGRNSLTLQKRRRG